MGKFLSGFVLPLLLLTGLRYRRRSLVSWYMLIFSSLIILSQAVFHIAWAINGDQWSLADAQWAKLIGSLNVQSWRSSYLVYFLVIHVFATTVALLEIHGRFDMDLWEDSWMRNVYCSIINLADVLFGFGYLFFASMEGSHLRVLCCLFLPAVQLVVGISHPSWASLPFFICSCVGLVNWSLTSDFLGLFRWWRCLLLYAGLNIFLLCAFQLPVEFSWMIQKAARFVGLYRISAE